jgi:hypothetical protein
MIASGDSFSVQLNYIKTERTQASFSFNQPLFKRVSSFKSEKGKIKVELGDARYEFTVHNGKCTALDERDMFQFSGTSSNYDVSMVLKRPIFVFGLNLYKENGNLIDHISINRFDYQSDDLHRIDGRKFMYEGEVTRGRDKKVERAAIVIECLD